MVGPPGHYLYVEQNTICRLTQNNKPESSIQANPKGYFNYLSNDLGWVTVIVLYL